MDDRERCRIWIKITIKIRKRAVGKRDKRDKGDAVNIHREGEYLVGTDLEKHLLLGIESSRLDDCVAEVLRREAYGVFGNPYFDFRETNLDFLARLPQLGSIWFWDIALQNIDGLYALTNLLSFGIHPKRPPIDFSRLPTLEEIVWEYNPRDQGIAALAGLRKLDLWRYAPKHRTFEGLEVPTGLDELEILWSNPSSLAGLPEFPRLKTLRISRCRNLETLAELPRIAPNLEHLVVTNCPRVADGPAVVQQLPHLNHAFVRDAVLVTRQA